MTDLGRRELLKLSGRRPSAAGSPRSARPRRRPCARSALSRPRGYGPRPARLHAEVLRPPTSGATVRVLADIVIPRDDRSGSATRCGRARVHRLHARRSAPRRAIASRRRPRCAAGWPGSTRSASDRFQKTFLDCTDAERTAVLDDIAWPKKAKPRAARRAPPSSASSATSPPRGFWSSRAGIEDLQYQGNTFVAEWKGCPEEMLTRLGVKYGADD